MKDFGYDSSVVEFAVSSLCRDVNATLSFTVKANNLHKIHCRGISEIASIGLLYDSWAIKVYDRDKIEGFHHDFGRYVIEFMDNEDHYPLYITVDTVEIGQ
jgi:hypothetical protein